MTTEKTPDVASVETPTEWMLRHIGVYAAFYSEVAPEQLCMDIPTARRQLAVYLGGNWKIVQQAQAARPPAILPDVRDVVRGYGDVLDRLRARVQALADLLQQELDVDAAALEEMRHTLDEIREVTK